MGISYPEESTSSKAVAVIEKDVEGHGRRMIWWDGSCRVNTTQMNDEQMKVQDEVRRLEIHGTLLPASI